MALSRADPTVLCNHSSKPGAGGWLSPAPLSITGLLPHSSALQPPCRSIQHVPRLIRRLQGYTTVVPLPSKGCYVSMGKKQRKFIVQSASFVPNYTDTLHKLNRGTGPAVRFPCDWQGWKMLVLQRRATSPSFHLHKQCSVDLGSIHIYILT